MLIKEELLNYTIDQFKTKNVSLLDILQELSYIAF